MCLHFIGNKDENGMAWTCTLITIRTERKKFISKRLTWAMLKTESTCTWLPSLRKIGSSLTCNSKWKWISFYTSMRPCIVLTKLRAWVAFTAKKKLNLDSNIKVTRLIAFNICTTLTKNLHGVIIVNSWRKKKHFSYNVPKVLSAMNNWDCIIVGKSQMLTEQAEL